MHSAIRPFNLVSFSIWVVGSSIMLPLWLYLSLILVKLLGYGAYGDKVGGWVFVPMTIITVLSLQWFILRRHLPKASRWVWGNISALFSGGLFIALGAHFVTATAVPEWSLMAIAALCYGLLLGIVQWFILRSYFASIFFWIVLNCVALLLVLLTIGRSISNNIDMLLLGGVPAIFTGLALWWVLGARMVRAQG